jgi:hypothetical protein
MNNELEGMWNVAILAQFKALSIVLHERREENYEKVQSK